MASRDGDKEARQPLVPPALPHGLSEIFLLGCWILTGSEAGQKARVVLEEEAANYIIHPRR